jgi:hypothetical protein
LEPYGLVVQAFEIIGEQYMGSIKYIHKLRINCIGLLICLVLTSNNVEVVHAEDSVYIIPGGIETYDYKQLLSRYESNSVTYIRSGITSQIEVLNNTIASENFDSLNGQYVDIIQKIEGLNSTKEQLIAYRSSLIEMQESSISLSTNAEDSLNPITPNVSNDNVLNLIQEINTQIANIDAQLAQYNSSKSTMMSNVQSAKLQENMSAFYKEYQQVLLHESQNKIKYDFLKKCFGLIIMKEQIDYYNSYQQYLSVVSNIESIKFSKGASTKSKIDTINLDIIKNQNSLLEYQNLFDNTKNSIKLETNTGDNITIKLGIDLGQKSYDLDTITKIFLASNTTYMQLQNYIKSYQNYLGSSPGTMSSASYQQLVLKIQDYQLQSSELSSNIKTYVRNAIQAHQYALNSKEVAKSDLVLKNENYNIIKKKLQYKKATTLELNQAYVEKESAEIAYYKCCYEIVLWENIIDNCLYGESL